MRRNGFDMKKVRPMRTACVLLFLSQTSAYADPIKDISEWSHIFTQAALNGDINAMGDQIDEARDKRIPIESVRQGLLNFKSLIKDENVIYAEEINDEKIGTFLERRTTIVMYSSQPLFYTTTFQRGVDGWQIIHLDMNTDLNKVIHLEWPHP